MEQPPYQRPASQGKDVDGSYELVCPNTATRGGLSNIPTEGEHMVVALNRKSVFDTMSHSRYLNWKELAVDRKCAIRSFLADRKATIGIGDIISEKFGMPDRKATIGIGDIISEKFGMPAGVSRTPVHLSYITAAFKSSGLQATRGSRGTKTLMTPPELPSTGRVNQQSATPHKPTRPTERDWSPLFATMRETE
ncbi:hypothetical protein HPB50_006015 [Hyalomma asiaticum]|uniref:Uncharacterized protein n=1 Tax=Hyalomma asiaticum TaxID=266040 RepID=A0ACB7SNB4_HYAAI|nr:hypothetical protein HPB50_006015 [Hyalomma asiaticum]